MKGIIVKAIVVLSFVAMPGMAFAGKHDDMVVPGYQQVITPAGITPSAARIKAAILHAAKKRHWEVVATELGKVTLRYAPRTHEVVVAVRYDDRGFKIEYVSSKSMNYETGRGKSRIHGNYNIWIRNLADGIQSSEVLGMPEPERMEQ